MIEFDKIVSHSRTGEGQMCPERRQLIYSLFEKYIDMFSSRDDLVGSYFSENFTGFSGSSDVLLTNKAHALEMIQQDLSQVSESLGIEMLELTLQDLADDVVVATGFFHLHLPLADPFLSEEISRLVLIFRYEQTDWKIVHAGLSIPFAPTQGAEMYPVSAIEKRNCELEQMIEVRTQELAQANRLLQIRSETDGLTQISNRRYFDSMLKKEWKRGQRFGTELSVIMLDIDYFKKYNDHYGHLAGDSCLTKIAQGLNQVMTRAADVVARYGGEEFVVLLPNTDQQAALRVAQHLQETVVLLAIPHAQSSFGIVTVSLGVASLIPSDQYPAVELVKLADIALYRAKSAGRNRVEVYDCGLIETSL
ncbi:MAG TPA: diguanylate cyclase [Thiopseudomonas sp.]|nr:diguanylate cyclase [Thiopseudomonas sp.]